MSGYNRFEQAVGTALDRFPRTKKAVERLYQRANYHLFDMGFEYELHEDASLHRADELYGKTTDREFFVGFYDICPWDSSADRYLVHQLNDSGTADIVMFHNDKSKRLATTEAWNYQQGSRTHWHPARDDAVVYNDMDERRKSGG